MILTVTFFLVLQEPARKRKRVGAPRRVQTAVDPRCEAGRAAILKSGRVKSVGIWLYQTVYLVGVVLLIYPVSSSDGDRIKNIKE